MESAPPLAFIRLLSDFQVVSYANVAGWAFLTYDYILTFPTEVNLFWGKKWSYARLLFTLNRYYIHVPQAMLLSAMVSHNPGAKFCGVVFRAVAVAEACIQLALIEAIICLRLWSICGHYKYIKFVYAFAFASTTAAICIFAVSAAGGAVNSVAGPGITLCEPVGMDVFLYCSFIPVMALDVIACFLAVHRYRSHLKLVHAVVGDTHGTRLLFVLVRDSIIYFVSVLSLEILQVVQWKFGAVTQHSLLCSILAAMWCTLGNRLLLNPRELNEELSQSNTSNSVSASASIAFGSAGSGRTAKTWEGSGRSKLDEVGTDSLPSLE